LSRNLATAFKVAGVSAGDDSRMRRRLAATAATAAIAVGGGFGTASAQTSPVRGGKAPTIAGSERTNGADDMDAIAREELERHRRQLATGLAPHVSGVDSARIEAALTAGTPAELARRIGVNEEDVDAAFEAMSRRALERRMNR
jgi:hypothetical protein